MVEMATVLGRCFCRQVLISSKRNKLLDLPSIYQYSAIVPQSHLKRSAFSFNVFPWNIQQNNVCKINPNSQFSLTGPSISVKYYSDKKNSKSEDKKDEKKLNLFQRFKKMYKEYWYVLVPVHLVTSAAWFGGFYYAAKSGVDVASLLESMHFSEKIVNPLRDSSMGHLAVAYALYKIATPARYTVTLGGTTVSINYLKKWGYIKPVPSAEQLKEIYIEKRDNLIETVRETKEGLIGKADKIKDQKDNIMDDFEKSIKKLKESSTETIKSKKKDIVENINKTLHKNHTK